MSIWTPAVVNDLALLVDEGLSGGVIADRLSAKYDYEFTRNSILGKTHRLGLSLERNPGDPASTSKRRKRALTSRGENAHVVRQVQEALVKPPVPAPTFPQINSDGGPVPLNISLFELTDATCRWPTSDDSPFTFCGCQTQDGSPYCGHHSIRAFAGKSRKPLHIPEYLIGKMAA